MNMDTLFLVFLYGSIVYIGIFFGKFMFKIQQTNKK